MATDLRARIVSAAAELFRERGYGAVGVTDVCKAASVSRAHFYRLFSGKSDLGVAVIGIFAAERDALVERALKPELPIRGQIQRMFAMLHAQQVESVANLGMASGSAFSLFGGELGDEERLVRAAIDAAMGRWRARIAAALQAADARGELRVPDPIYPASALLAFAEGALALARITNEPRVLIDLAPAAMSLMVDRKATGAWPMLLMGTGAFQSLGTGAFAAVGSGAYHAAGG